MINHISTKLGTCVYKYKDANICKRLVQPICLIIIKYLIGFLTYKTPIDKPPPPSKFCDHNQKNPPNCPFPVPAPIGRSTQMQK